MVIYNKISINLFWQSRKWATGSFLELQPKAKAKTERLLTAKLKVYSHEAFFSPFYENAALLFSIVLM